MGRGVRSIDGERGTIFFSCGRAGRMRCRDSLQKGKKAGSVCWQTGEQRNQRPTTALLETRD